MGRRVAILSYALWTRQFGARPIIGEHVQLGARSYQILGVMPRGFNFPGESEVWIPLTVPTTRVTFEPFRGWLPVSVIGRVVPELSLRTADQQVRVRWQQLADVRKQAGAREQDQTAGEIELKGAVTPLQRELVGDRRSALLVLLGATGLLLLIACANVTNLLLSHAALRRREIAVREALGATRLRLVRQLLTESLALSAAGAALGVALAPLALSAMRAIMPAALAGVAPAEVDLRVLAFAAALALMTGIGFGLWPALGSTRDALGETIKSGGGLGTTFRSGGRAQRVMVVAEIALTLMLLVGAGLMLRSFESVMALDAGMDPARVGTLELTFVRGLPGAVRLQRIEEILARLSATSGIDAAGVVNDLPLRGDAGVSARFTVDGAPPPKAGEMSFARWLIASGDYFKTLGVPVIRGRPFAITDDSLAPRVAIINASMAKKYWPGTDALGHTFHAGARGSPAVTVVGIAADVRELGLERDAEQQMYFPIYAVPPDRLALVARSTLPATLLLARMVAAVRGVDPTQAVYNVRMMDDVVGASTAPRRTNTLLISAFATLALILASLGVYAVISYGVALRSRELGVRAALGATAGDLVTLVSYEMVWVATAGLLTGLAGAWALTRVMAKLLYGVDAHDAATFVIVPLVLAIAAAAATLAPAWRARRVDLVSVLRAD
jgi:putative ABC transport system permease protein